MRAADPVHNVELRRNSQGHDSVVFAFPYRADIVDAVRAIPGRRFDWEAKEWWAPRADAVAPFVKGVLERHPTLSVAPDVTEWLSRAVTGWIGRVTSGKLEGRGHFILDTIAGELDEPLAELADERGGRLWLPFTRTVAEALLETRGARLDPRALRCASRLQVGPRSRRRPRSRSSRATASCASSWTSTGTRRRCPPSSRCPPARRTAARCRSTRTCSSRWSTTCGCSASSRPPTRARCSTGCAASTTRRSTTCAARAPSDARRAGGRGAPGRRAAAVPARRRRLRAARAAHVPRRRAGPRQDRPGARRAGGRRRLSRP